MLNKRKPCVKLTDTNIQLASLPEAARRAVESGVFVLSEKSGISAYESDSENIPEDKKTSLTVNKVEAALAGIDYVHQKLAVDPEPTPSPEPAPSPESALSPAPIE